MSLKPCLTPPMSTTIGAPFPPNLGKSTCPASATLQGFPTFDLVKCAGTAVTDLRFQHDLLIGWRYRYGNATSCCSNKMLSKEDRGLINMPRDSDFISPWSGHQTARVSIRWTTRFGGFCRSESTVARSATSIIWKNDWRAASLWSERWPIDRSVACGVIDCVNVSARNKTFEHRI